MPFYPDLRRKDYGPRAAQHLLDLRAQLKADLPRRSVDDSLMLATWNIRDFDSNKFGHGPRLPESYFYIAEIISHFDLVAVQEVNENLEALERVKKILGPSWTYIATDITEGTSGNGERMCFLFDRNKVQFRNIAGEIVLPDSMLVDGKKQFARSPFLVAFQCGWFKFNLCTVHIYYGSDSGVELQRRIAEIRQIAKFLAKRAKDSKESYILLGDFNIVSPEHDTMKALTDAGFVIPHELRNKPTNMFETKHYDQIAFLSADPNLNIGAGVQAGAFKLYNSVFKSDEMATYRDSIGRLWPTDDTKVQDYYAKDWRTWQMSDHLPMWIELGINFSDAYLKKLIP